MRPPAHRRSLLAEIASLLLSAYVLAVGLGMVAGFVTVRLLDPLGTVPPRAVLIVPMAVLGAGLVGLVGASWAAAWFGERRAHATHLGETMRVAE